jgi:hypothetical protein
MNVSAKKKHVQLKRTFKEDDYCEQSTFHLKRKRHSAILCKSKTAFNSKTNAHPYFLEISSDSDKNKKEKKEVSVFRKRSKILINQIKLIRKIKILKLITNSKCMAPLTTCSNLEAISIKENSLKRQIS